jgi:hypothetical protein
MNLAVVKRRLVSVTEHELADAVVGVQLPAGDPGAVQAGRGERKGRWLVIATILFEDTAPAAGLEVDAVPAQPGRRARLQSSPAETDMLDRLGQGVRRRLARAAGRTLLLSDVDKTVQKRPGRHHDSLRDHFAAVLQHQSPDAVVVLRQPGHRTDDNIYKCFIFNKLRDT